MNTIGQAEAGPSERTSHPNETGPSNHASIGTPVWLIGSHPG